MIVKNKKYPWYRWSDGCVPELSRCTLAEIGLLTTLAQKYWKYQVVPDELPDYLMLDPDDISDYWNDRTKNVWKCFKRYLDDQLENNIDTREQLKIAREVRNAKRKNKEMV